MLVLDLLDTLRSDHGYCVGDFFTDLFKFCHNLPQVNIFVGLLNWNVVTEKWAEGIKYDGQVGDLLGLITRLFFHYGKF